ncbi:hypothetical protein [Spiroplasma poulsonii]|uniref:hypothetical protein n=1 Tax=Spiroplasma poulsonii TaxID=2138 RepID=UPI001F547DBB|nr:hypothetical protein [Spiroplasma poulsonii]
MKLEINNTALSGAAVNKIKTLHQEHLQQHYKKITSFWRKSIIIDIIFCILITILATSLLVGIILKIVNTNNNQLQFYLIYLTLPLLVVTIIIYILIKAGAVSISLFLNRLDYNAYYRIAIEDLWKDEITLDEVSNNFKIIPEPNFTSFSKDPKKKKKSFTTKFNSSK